LTLQTSMPFVRIKPDLKTEQGVAFRGKK